ncbi:Fpg/Nei family DNA glycosylase [Streptomyces sp. A73]|uniref:Fpg/Nei family DNA glycosylase n=1 Tax=Streptomyces TaxID=1883 RepID=UPI000C177343|nr:MULTISPECIES: DNA-formamidopyrimidine glycosylase family protein [unclassified Streptomyces]MBQ0862656.1 Fpg/Nei family DNA glycosylase [Streptomyces sp. RK75]MBQ1119335.1 Fpg/Nei family DNA glycosylase [Streptomyces sp. B15]MBQ1160328.1 Fpg/Nei family DNA glycosylase [Streptomyces sp. A73]
MPELPEVEALRGFLAERLTGRAVRRVLPVAISVLKTYDPPLDALEGRAFTGVARHGKFLDLQLAGAGDSGLHLVVHLARAGWLRWQDTLPAAPPRPGKGPLALRVELAGEPAEGFELTEAGTQKRLAVHVVRDPAEVPGVARLGPEPLSPAFDRAAFAAVLAGQRHRIKGLLRDQSVISGIGNAYSDEILHAARMSPFRLAADLSDAEVTTLFTALREVLSSAVERARGLSATELKAGKRLGLRVHGRAGEPCPVCGDTVRSVSFRDSTLEYCPTCQTGGKPLADRRLSRLLK